MAMMAMKYVHPIIATVLALAAACGGSKPTARVASETTLQSATLPAETAARPIAPRRPQEAVPAPIDTAPIEEWTTRYPDAARELGAWLNENPRAAADLLAWDTAEPEKSKVLVLWAITHPYEDIGSFLFNRSGWDTFDPLRGDSRPAVERFMAWCRRAPGAAAELVNHPAGLSWVAAHALRGPPARK